MQPPDSTNEHPNEHPVMDRQPRVSVRDALLRYKKQSLPGLAIAISQHRRINFLCKHRIADRPFELLESREIAQYRRELLAAGQSNTTINNDIAILSRCYETAGHQWGMDIVNPVRELNDNQHIRNRNRRVTSKEERRLLQQLDTPYDDMVRLLLGTALRRVELTMLYWDEVNLLERYLLVQDADDPKKDRLIPLSSRTISILMKYPRHKGKKVFAINPVVFSQVFHRAALTANIRDLQLRDLRHEAIQRFQEAGHFSKAEIRRMADCPTL